MNYLPILDQSSVDKLQFYMLAEHYKAGGTGYKLQPIQPGNKDMDAAFEYWNKMHDYVTGVITTNPGPRFPMSAADRDVWEIYKWANEAVFTPTSSIPDYPTPPGPPTVPGDAPSPPFGVTWDSFTIWMQYDVEHGWDRNPADRLWYLVPTCFYFSCGFYRTTWSYGSYTCNSKTVAVTVDRRPPGGYFLGPPRYWSKNERMSYASNAAYEAWEDEQATFWGIALPDFVDSIPRWDGDPGACKVDGVVGGYVEDWINHYM